MPSPCALTSERFLVGEHDARSDYLFNLFDFEFEFNVGLFDHDFFSFNGAKKGLVLDDLSSDRLQSA